MSLAGVLKTVLFLLCFALFACQFSFVVRSYINRETTVGIEMIDFETMRLPTVTLCANFPYKPGYLDRKVKSVKKWTKRDISYVHNPREISEENYLNYTYNFEELFTMPPKG